MKKVYRKNMETAMLNNELGNELIGVLNAISVVTKRLATKITILEENSKKNLRKGC